MWSNYLLDLGMDFLVGNMVFVVWIDKSISLCSKTRLMCFLVTSIFLYACESWTLTAELKKKKNTSHGNKVLTQDTTHLTQRPTRKSVSRSSRQSDHTKTSWPT